MSTHWFNSSLGRSAANSIGENGVMILSHKHSKYFNNVLTLNFLHVKHAELGSIKGEICVDSVAQLIFRLLFNDISQVLAAVDCRISKTITPNGFMSNIFVDIVIVKQ